MTNWKPLRSLYSDGSRYGSGVPKFTAVRSETILRIVQALRASVGHVLTLNADPPKLAAIADAAEALAATLKEHTNEKRPLRMFHHSPDEVADLTDVLPYSPVSGRMNPLSPPVRVGVEERVAEDGSARREVVGRCTAGEAYEGPPGQLHGGWVAAIHDQVLGLVPFVNGDGGFTASIKVSYRQPTPLGAPLEFRGWLDRQDGRKTWVKGVCEVDGEVVTEAEGFFLSVQRAASAKQEQA